MRSSIPRAGRIVATKGPIAGVIREAGGDPEVILILQNALAEARTKDIVSIAIVAVSSEDHVTTVFLEAHAPALVCGLLDIQHRLMTRRWRGME
jgi:hypothetical protein